MNRCLVELFESPSRMNRLTNGLSKAFEIVRAEMPKGNPAVGILREHVLIGYLMTEFGEDQIVVPKSGTVRGLDCWLCGKRVSIKTVTGNGDVKVLWTVDPLEIGREISRDYVPNSDIFLVNINWGKRDKSIYYIPMEVQLETRSEFKDEYLNAKVGTNHRGIAISRSALRILKSHDLTLTAEVDWVETELTETPYDRWVDYWS